MYSILDGAAKLAVHLVGFCLYIPCLQLSSGNCEESSVLSYERFPSTRRLELMHYFLYCIYQLHSCTTHGLVKVVKER
ncbi:hypothetical protein BDV19DRAFT_216333 [Aspergillus venezuelensis]